MEQALHPDRALLQKDGISPTPASAERKTGRIEFLDVLRGIAALFVLLQHCVVSLAFLRWTCRYINFGEIGVVVFFIVSGFIIPVSLEKYNSLSRFWIGRVLRLWPIYVASLIAAVLVNPIAKELPAYYAAHPARFVLGNFSMFQEYLGIPNALGAYWTLSLELIFYVACSALFFFGGLRRTKLWLALLALSLLLAQIGLAAALHRSLPAGRIGLLVTAFFGTMLYRHLSAPLSRTSIVLVLCGLFSVFTICFWIRFDKYPSAAAGTLPHPDARTTILSWGCAYLIFLTIFMLRGRQFPRVLLWIGQISYPLYLFHGIVLVLAPKNLPWPVLLIGVAGVSLAVSQVVHVWIEQPVGRFQKTLLPRRAVALPT